MAINNNINIIVSAVDKTKKALATSTKGFSKFQKSVEKNSKTIKQFGVLTGIALAGLVAGANKAINSAVDLEESINAVNVVFGEGSDRILKYSEDVAKSTGLSSRAFNQLSTETGTLLKVTGLSLDEVADSTIMLTERASDLASVFNTDVDLAMSAINQALRGETEAIRKFGSDVTDASLDAFFLSEGINKTTKELTQQEKVLFRVQKIMADTNQVQGDFANTSEGLANRQRILSARIENATAKFGLMLIPIKALIFDGFEPLLSQMEGYVDDSAKMEANTVALKEKVEAFVKVLGFLKDFIFFVGEAILGVGGIVGFIIAQIVISLGHLKDAIVTTFSFLKEVMFAIIDGIKEAFDFLFTYINNKIEGFKNLLNTLKSAFNKAKSAIGLGGGGETIEGARAVGGTVQAGKTYKVGEGGEELFTPTTTGSIIANKDIGGNAGDININMGGVTVNNQADENRLVDKIKNELTRTIQLEKFGIS